MNWELNVPNIVSERCELVKLRPINRSGPVVLRNSVLFDVAL